VLLIKLILIESKIGGKMKKIDFNSSSFLGFENRENVLLDTGSLLAYLHKHDAWHKTVKKLFDKHIFNNDETLLLYINPTIINEVLHRSGRPLDEFLKAFPEKAVDFSYDDKQDLKKELRSRIKELVMQEVLIVLDADKESLAKQIDLTESLGAADATNISFAEAYGISFLTLDSALVKNVEYNKSEFENIQNIYYTTPKHRDYFTNKKK
jgi:predicted nucleic acid-binding protein